MKNAYLFPLIIVCSFAAGGCDPGANPFFGNTTPSAPTGLATLALDGQVELWWNPNPESDIEGYKVYSASSAGGRFLLIGTTASPQFVHRGLTNGVRYYYAVSAYNRDGEESAQTRDQVVAIPRPEGYSLALFDYTSSPSAAGYDFSSETFGPYNDNYTDIYFGNDTMFVWQDSDIEDMGYTRDLDEVVSAPAGGWSTTKSAALIRGHTYVVWTWDDHYAKFRVANIYFDHVVIDWAYQMVTSSPNLQHRPDRGGQRLPLILADGAVQ